MLRQRIVPAARGCFRDDRRGRPAPQRRAVFVFQLADREVVSSDVQGSLAQPLRRCLAEAMDRLQIPPFHGTVSVRYPIYTAARLPPPVLSLDSDVADAVDEVTGDTRRTTEREGARVRSSDRPNERRGASTSPQ